MGTAVPTCSCMRMHMLMHARARANAFSLAVSRVACLPFRLEQQRDVPVPLPPYCSNFDPLSRYGFGKQNKTITSRASISQTINQSINQTTKDRVRSLSMTTSRCCPFRSTSRREDTSKRRYAKIRRTSNSEDTQNATSVKRKDKAENRKIS